MPRYPKFLIILVCFFLWPVAAPGWAKEKPEALRNLKEAVRKNPYDAQAYYHLGLKYEELGRQKEALKAFQQAASLKPDYAEAYFRLGKVKAARGDLDTAIKDFQRTLQLQKDFPEARAYLSRTYDQEGLGLMEQERWSAAAEAFREAIRSNPQADAPLNNLGVACFKQNRWPEALSAFQDAVRANPNNSEAHYNLGLLYNLMNNNAGTHEQLRILSRLDANLWTELANFVYKPRKLKLSESSSY